MAPEWFFEIHEGRWRQANNHTTPHPARPMRWHEIVRDRKVRIRSQKPLHVLITVTNAAKGERIYEATRLSRASSVHAVHRRLVFGLIEGS